MRVKSLWFVVAPVFIVVLCVQGEMFADSLNKHMKNADNFMSKGDIESAIIEYQNALRRQPGSVWAQSRLGMAYEELGNGLFVKGEIDRAIDAYKNASESAPTEPYWHERLGVAWEKRGDREAAVNEYRTAAELLPLDDGLQLKYEQVSGAPHSSEDACTRKVKRAAATTMPTGKVNAPVPVRKPDPPYAEWARNARLEGTVVLWIVIDGEGSVACTNNVRPLGLGLDANAMETVRTWKFQPATRNGVPVPVKVSVEIQFKLF